jgi:hypothetical protein
MFGIRHVKADIALRIVVLSQSQVLLLQVTKSDEYPWSVLKPDVFAAVMDHYTSGATGVQFTDPIFGSV